MDSNKKDIAISVIIPVYNEAGTVDSTLNALQKMRDSFAVEIIVVDGDANSSTISAISHDNIIKMVAPKERALQMNFLFGLLRNNAIRFLYLLGVSPHRLAKLYSDTREK